MTLSIRPAVPGDAPIVARFVRELAEYERLLHEVEGGEAEFDAALFGPNPRVFCDIAEWNGEPVQKVRKAHDAVVAACQKLLQRHVSPHIWRHTVATWLMQGGAEPFKAAGFLAMSLETLLRVYGHHHPDHSSDVHETMRKRKKAA